MAADFHGTGWRFPILPTRGGGLGYVSGEENIEQSLLIMLQTGAGSRVMRPDFATQLPEMVFAPGSPQNLARIETYVRDAVRDHEPRAELDDVQATLDPRDETTVVVSIQYRVRQSNTRQNLVFPFYLGTTEVGA